MTFNGENKKTITNVKFTAYEGKSKETMNFIISDTREKTMEFLDGIFGECPFDEMLLYFALVHGIMLHPATTDKIAIRINDGKITKVWFSSRS